MNTFNQVMLGTIMVTVWLVMISAISFPTSYGKWLQKIDNGRFEMIDCDCTAEAAD